MKQRISMIVSALLVAVMIFSVSLPSIQIQAAGKMTASDFTKSYLDFPIIFISTSLFKKISTLKLRKIRHFC